MGDVMYASFSTETGTPIPSARAAPDPWSFITPRPVQCLLCQAMSSEVALYIARRNGGLSFHTSPVNSSAFPIHWQNCFCAR